MNSRRWSFAFFVVLTLIGCFLYSNSRHHAYHLDDFHSVVNNPALRSLDRLPDFFTDPTTFSVYRLNVDYRPVLQTSYALNYQCDGYAMPVWHWTNVAIHIWCAFCLYLLARELLSLSEVEARERRAVPVLAALVFLVHPVNSGVVNYISARSSALTAAFLLTAFTLDLRGRRWAALTLFLLALFTKVEAVAAVAVFWALSVFRVYLLNDRQLSQPAARLFLAKPREWFPYLGATAFYLVARSLAMRGIDFAGAAAPLDLTRVEYLWTQMTVWWAYLYNWWCPLQLVADTTTYPTYRSAWQAPVLLAQVGWALVVLALGYHARRAPHYLLLAFGGLALISPTSSVVPLAEMMNEHRPYLPVALVSVIFLGLLVRFLLRLPAPWSAVGWVTVLVWLACLASLTWQRNAVFLSAESYWGDVLRKAPSERSHNNFGLALMGAGLMEQARSHFQEAVKRSPNYSVAHINLAITLAHAGRTTEALTHYNQAVACDRGAGDALLWRGRFFLGQRDYQRAKADFQAAARLSNDRYSVAIGLAQASAGLGEAEAAAEQALSASGLDQAKFQEQMVEVFAPFFTSKEQARSGLVFFARLERDWPEAWWIPANQANLLRKLGLQAEAAERDSRTQQLRGTP